MPNASTPRREVDNVWVRDVAATRPTVTVIGRHSRRRGSITQHLTLLWAADGFVLSCVSARTGTPRQVVMDAIVPLNLAEAFVVYAEMHQPPDAPDRRHDDEGDMVVSLLDDIIAPHREAAS